MLFSKTFGYALRGILYVAKMQDEKRNIQVDEIAMQLNVPRHFMGKILKKLVKEKMLKSSKGPSGGFSIANETLTMPLWSLVEVTDGFSTYKNCVLRLSECNSQNPCPLHYQIEGIKQNMVGILISTNIQDLLKGDKQKFIKSISSLDQHDKVFNFINLNSNNQDLSARKTKH